VEQKYFFEKNPRSRYQKNKHHCLLADPPEIGISKISEDANKKKVFGGFFGNCLRMQKPIKFIKFGHWDMAIGCGPRSRKHSPSPQSRLVALDFRPICLYLVQWNSGSGGVPRQVASHPH
jgi:hypothetical protein